MLNTEEKCFTATMWWGKMLHHLPRSTIFNTLKKNAQRLKTHKSGTLRIKQVWAVFWPTSPERQTEWKSAADQATNWLPNLLTGVGSRDTCVSKNAPLLLSGEKNAPLLQCSTGEKSSSTNTLCPYLIFVTGTTGVARVKNSVRCKFFQIERKKTTYFTLFGVNFSYF